MPAGKAKKTKGNDEKHHVVKEALKATASGLPTLSATATKPKQFTEPTTTEPFAEDSKSPVCRQLGCTVGTPGSAYFYTRNAFLIPVAMVSMELYRKSFYSCYRSGFYHGIYVSLPPTSQTHYRTQHVRSHVTRGILASNGQRSVHKRDRLPQMRRQRSEYDANATR